MRAVNLMPRDERRERLEMGRLPLLAAAGGVVAVTAMAFLLASSASGSADETKAEIQAVETAIAQLPKAPDTEVSTGALVQERSNRVAALAAALSSRTAFDRVLRDISLVFPESAWLTQLEASTPHIAAALPGSAVPPGQAAGTSIVTIKGATFSHDTVATVLARLSVVPSLTDVRLISTALVQPVSDESSKAKPGKAFVTFDVSATVKTGDTP